LYIANALLAAGHPSGNMLRVIERLHHGNELREAAVHAEQGGLNKAQILVKRLNVFWGLGLPRFATFSFNSSLTDPFAEGQFN
jgi:hypothetical protein